MGLSGRSRIHPARGARRPSSGSDDPARTVRMDVAREPDAYQAAFAELVALEGRRRALRGQG